MMGAMGHAAKPRQAGRLRHMGVGYRWRFPASAAPSSPPGLGGGGGGGSSSSSNRRSAQRAIA